MAMVVVVVVVVVIAVVAAETTRRPLGRGVNTLQVSGSAAASPSSLTHNEERTGRANRPRLFVRREKRTGRRKRGKVIGKGPCISIYCIMYCTVYVHAVMLEMYCTVLHAHPHTHG